MMTEFSQFSRWRCPKCGKDGIDSWNKAVFDGTSFDVSETPNPWILGGNCAYCVWPCVVLYGASNEAPRAIFGPIGVGTGCFDYESDAFAQIENGAGDVLERGVAMDADWSGGCVTARGQLQ